ncbi:MAG: PD40 domain-containing protein [Ignavibacteria bacterium]|nr:PD40 domain-containing protein [Ignavibacteria bacterium]
MKHLYSHLVLLSLCVAGSLLSYINTHAALFGNTPGTLQHILGGHGGWILDACWSPDSKYVITGSEDKTEIIWDAASGKRLHTLHTNYKNGINKVLWSPDGSKVSTGGDGSDIWDTQTGDKLLTIKGFVFEWSPDGKWLFIGNFDSTAYILDGNSLEIVQQLNGSAVRIILAKWSYDSQKIITHGAYDSTAVVWNAPLGTKLLTLPGINSFLMDIFWSTDGTRIMTMSDTSLVTWNALTGERISTAIVPMYSQYFSPDGTKIIYNSTVYDTQSGKIVSNLVGNSESSYSYSWSPDNRHLASSGNDNTVFLWDALAGTKLHTLQGHNSKVSIARWSPDSSRVVTGGGHNYYNPIRNDPRDFTARIWDVNTGKQIHVLMQHHNQVKNVNWSPDGSLLASCSADTTTIIWNTTTGDTVLILRGHSNRVENAYWSPSGDRILTRGGDSSSILWDAISGNQLFTLKSFSYNLSANWRPDGKQIATTNLNSTNIWDAATGIKIYTLQGHTKTVNDAVWSPDGKYIATASEDKTAILWDASSFEKLITLSTSEYSISTLIWSPDGSRIAIPTGTTKVSTEVWDVNSRTKLFTIQKNKAVWYRDGKRLIVGNFIYDGFTGVYLDSLSDNVLSDKWWSPDRMQFAVVNTSTVDDKFINITIWNATSGKKLYELYGHRDFINNLQWSPDGTRIASAGYDNTARIWLINVSTSVQEEPTPLHNSAEFSLFPNPTDNSLHLSFAAESAVSSAVQICDLLGRTVATADIPAGSKEWTMSVGNLPAGLYAVRWNGGVRKLVVQ